MAESTGKSWIEVIENDARQLVPTTSDLEKLSVPAKEAIASLGDQFAEYRKAAAESIKDPRNKEKSAATEKALKTVHDTYDIAKKGLKDVGSSGEKALNGLEGVVAGLKLLDSVSGSVENARLDLATSQNQTLAMQVKVWNDLSKSFQEAGNSTEALSAKQVSSAKEAALSLASMTMDPKQIKAAGVAYRKALQEQFDVKAQQKINADLNAAVQSGLKGAREEIKLAKEQGRPKEEIAKLEEDYNNKQLFAKKTLAEQDEALTKKEMENREAMAKSLETEAEGLLKPISMMKETIETDIEAATKMGAPFETISNLEQKMVDMKYQEYEIAKYIYEEAKRNGEQGVALAQKQQNMRKAEVAAQTAAVGAQRSAIEKMLGGFMSGFTNVGITTGPTRARRFGAGYMTQGGPGGFVVDRGKKGGPGYEERLGAARLKAGMTGQRQGFLGTPAERKGGVGVVELKDTTEKQVDATKELVDAMNANTSALTGGTGKSVTDVVKTLSDSIDARKGRTAATTESPAKTALPYTAGQTAWEAAGGKSAQATTEAAAPAAPAEEAAGNKFQTLTIELKPGGLFEEEVIRIQADHFRENMNKWTTGQLK